MTKEEALKLALMALEEAWYHVGTFQPTEKAIDLYDEARTAIKEALAQTQEPKIKTIDPFESSRVADYNRGWNDCLFASGIVKQTEQEPVDFDAIIADIEAISCRYQGDPSHDHCPYKIRSESADTVRRHASYYTTPPQPTQVKLTDEGIEELANEYLFAEEDLGMLFVGGSVEFARAIEAAHGIKE